MYKINYCWDARVTIIKENFNEVKLTSIIQEELLEKELQEVQDIIILLEKDGDYISAVGYKDGKNIDITDICTKTFIVRTD
ncbi:MAG: hypothetical protein GX981_00475 [Tissierellia bacterium]|nr:hypothetical protein [Tissierellia bacterium]